jgi:hypothetical protein
MSRLRLCAAGAVVLALLCPLPAAAQSASAPSLKAAFLVNFAKFVAWPAEALAADATITFCVEGDTRVADALDALAAQHPLGAHEMRVVRLKADVPSRDCHLLFVQGLGAKQSIELLQQLKGATVFTVGDEEPFAELGGVANFFVEGSRMRFAVNLQSAQRAHVQLSSRLLALAKIVKDAPNAVQH